MNAIPMALADMLMFQPTVFGDDRGFFMETFREEWFSDLGIDAKFVQDNHSLSAKGVLRGLHYQIKRPQGKLVRVTRGEVFDVAVDLRQSSPTFGQWVGATLSAENKQLLWVPPGFAHAFYVTSEEAEFQYKCTDYYNPGDEYCICWDDPTLAIDWPLVGGKPPRVSEKDGQGDSFVDAVKFG